MLLGYKSYQEQLQTITPATRRSTIVAPPADRAWLAAVAVGLIGAALVLGAVLLVG